MNRQHIQIISGLMNLSTRQIENTLKLLKEGATIPFISRYRKELTGSLDEVRIADIKQHSNRLEELDKRREAVTRSIEEQDKLTPELKQLIDTAQSIAELEDLYLPFRPKRKTRASVAREKGLEPLAEIIMQQRENKPGIVAMQYVNDVVADAEEALQGARDIVAEWINEDKQARHRIRNLFTRDAFIISRLVRGKEDEGVKYRDYFEFKEKLSRCPSHRLLAMRRGEEEGILRLTIEPSGEKAIDILRRLFVKGKGESSQHVDVALTDSYKRLLAPSMIC